MGHREGAAHPRLQGRAWRAPRLALLPVILLALPCIVPVAWADGGAPNLAYVAGSGSTGESVAVIDIGQRQVVAQISIGTALAGIVVSPDGRQAYVAEPKAGRLAMIDTHQRALVGSIAVGAGPDAIALDLARSNPTLYVSDRDGNALVVVDPSQRRVLASIPVAAHPAGLAIAGSNSGISDASDEEVYLASPESNLVTVVSLTHRRVLTTIAVPGGPVAVAVPATGGVAYVATQAGTIVALSLASHQVLGTILSVPGSQWGTMDYDAVTNEVYVPDATSGKVYVLSPVAPGGGAATPFATPSPTASALPAEPARVLAVGGGPSAVAITFEGAYGFVAQRAAGRVVMLDVSAHTTLATVVVGGAPEALVTGPYPPALSASSTAIVDLGILGVLLGAMVVALFVGAAGARRGVRERRLGPMPPTTKRAQP